MLDLAKRRYSDRLDFVSAEGWMRNICLKGPMVFLPIRSDDAFLVAMIACVPWLPGDWECNVIMVCAEEGAHWQAIGLARASIVWAKKRNCVEWRISSETDSSIESIAARVGAEELTHRYRLRL
jgi:hypothetical protein